MKTRKICIAVIIMLLFSVTAFATDEVIEDGTTVIKEQKYQERYDLQHVVIPDSVETIE